jgi:signal transduction histidine kinase
LIPKEYAMRAKLSTTADGIYRSFTPPAHTASVFFKQDAGVRQDASFGEQAEATPRRSSNGLPRPEMQRAHRPTQSISADVRGEGLLHDARNLVSAIGLYCDLLSMPGVLKPEHRQYPEELRLLGTRSRVLIEHLMRSLVSQSLSDQDSGPAERLAEPTAPESYDRTERRIQGALPHSRTPQSGAPAKPVSLRTTVERCSGLLRRVAKDRPIEFIYGAAADVPISTSEEAIERILVNLVRNASQALDHREPLASPADSEPHPLHPGLHSTDLLLHHHGPRRPGTSSLPGSSTAIRISVGPLLDRIGEARSWPFQHVRLVVEDAGCGMSSAQLHTLLSGQMAASRGTHGIGFRVVRELVAASNGDLRAASTPGIGTRVQIEWPVAATSTAEKHGASMQRKRDVGTTLKSPAIERQHRSIPPSSHASAIVEGRPGVN